MNIRHLPFAKSILRSLTNYTVKINGIIFVVFLFLCPALASGFSGTPPGNVEIKKLFSVKEFSVFNANSLANLDLEIVIAQDGTAVMNTTGDTLNGINICPANPTAGCDFGQNNGVVRTNDNIIYTYDYSVNSGNEDVTVVAEAQIGTVWRFLPGFCNAGSTITGDGIITPSIITCKRGMQVSGTTESLPFIAIVSGKFTNGTPIKARGTVSGLNSAPVDDESQSIIVTAAPRFNLRKAFIGYSNYVHQGVDGFRINYRAYIEVYDDSNPSALNPRFGSAELSSPITFKDNVSSISDNARLVSCASDNSGNSGTITCTQDEGEEFISVEVIGANTSLSQYGGALSNSVRFIAGTYDIFVFIPRADVTDANNSLATINVLEDFDPTSLTGQSNFSSGIENTSDNSVAATIAPIPPPPTSGGGVLWKIPLHDYNTQLNLGSFPLVAPEQHFATGLTFFNNTGRHLTNLTVCDVIDNSKYHIAEIVPDSGDVYVIAGLPVPIVEFAEGYVNPTNWMPTGVGGNPVGIRNECISETIIWKPIDEFLPDNLGAITKFRIRYGFVTNNTSVNLKIRLQARDTDLNNQTIPTGTVLPNFATWRSNEFNPNYVDNDYYQNISSTFPSGNLFLGARFILARGVARITKETGNNNTVESVAAGGIIEYVLKPTLSTGGLVTPAQVTVLDVLPAGLTYHKSVQPRPPDQIRLCAEVSTIISCSSQQQVLIWQFNDHPPNVEIPQIIFKAKADLTVLNNQTVRNVAVINSSADPSNPNQQGSVRDVIGASQSTFLIFKNSNKPRIGADNTFNYTVSYRNASFVTDFSGMDFIDILPFRGDGVLKIDGTNTHVRTPASNFHGSLTLTSVSATTDSPTWYFTKQEPPTDIYLDPKHSSNLNPGIAGSVWCAGTAAGPDADCGFTLAEVTAVRMQDNTPMPRNNTIRSFTLNFSTSGNQTNDVYTNNSSGSVAEIALPVSSLNIPVTVFNSSIRGKVWYDTTGDGRRDTAEIGRVAGSNVTLNGTNSAGASVNQTTTTDANGDYAFNGLAAGNYTVQFTRPTNYRASPQNNVADDIDSDGDVSTLMTQTISLVVNDNRTNVDQGFFRLSLGGTIWRDSDNSGIFDEESESGIPNISVQLLDENGLVIPPAQTTNSNGEYLFNNLAAGDYRVRVNPNGLNGSSVFNQNPNDDINNDNNGIPQSGLLISNPITLLPRNEPIVNQTNGTTINDTVDFGFFVVPTAAGVALGGRVLTSDGRGIGKALVMMLDQDGLVHYAVTNPFGFYRFNDVPAGTTIIISVNAKNRTFEQSSRVISVTDELTEINFVANN